jgi:hypothetical protein
VALNGSSGRLPIADAAAVSGAAIEGEGEAEGEGEGEGGGATTTVALGVVALPGGGGAAPAVVATLLARGPPFDLLPEVPLADAVARRSEEDGEATHVPGTTQAEPSDASQAPAALRLDHSSSTHRIIRAGLNRTGAALLPGSRHSTAQRSIA